MIKSATYSVFALALAFPIGAGAEEPEDPDLTPAQQFSQLSEWVGSWNVLESTRLKIVFESTANGSTIVERWETASGLHSMTVYHMDGEALVATHYCPQGNQPTLATTEMSTGEIRFSFRNASDLDPGEGYAHDLSFVQQADGSIIRSEVYWGPEGAGQPSRYTLKRAAPQR